MLSNHDDVLHTTRQRRWFIPVGLLVAFIGTQLNVFFSPLNSLPRIHEKSILALHTFLKDSNITTRLLRERTQIAYAISVTKCGLELKEAAAVHSRGIDLAQESSRYTYVRYAFVHVDAVGCVPTLRQLGYRVIVKDSPVKVEEISNNSYYQKVVENYGCCGMKEFLKLYAYELVQADVVVHLDTDVMLLKNIDELFDAMTLPPRVNSFANTPVTHNNRSLPNMVDFFYTRDYYLGSQYSHEPEKQGVQGGMFIVKPNQTRFQELLHMIRESDYTKGSGWGRIGYGGFWGAPQIQGLLSYYTRESETAVELNRCIYNNMGDDPYKNKSKMHKGGCTTGLATCEDCRATPLDQIKMIHLTLCGKPWYCLRNRQTEGELCYSYHRLWFQLRKSLEDSWGRTLPDRPFWTNASLSYCTNPQAETGGRPKRGQYHPLFNQTQG